MKKYIIMLSSIALASFLLGGCKGNMDYDISENVNKDITVFGNEISVPVGSLGPFTIESTIGGLGSIPGIGPAIADFIKEDEQGRFVFVSTGDIYKINVYELEKKLDDPSVPSTFKAGTADCYPASMLSMLSYVGLIPFNQKMIIYAGNPLWESVDFRSETSLSCYSATGAEPYSQSVEALSKFTLGSSTQNKKVAEVEIPLAITDPISSFSMRSLEMDLPANPSGKLYSTTGNLFFSINYEYDSNLAVGEKMDFKLNPGPIGGFNLPVAQFKVSECQITLELENTLPIAITASEIKMARIKEGYDPESGEKPEYVVDENIYVTPEISIPGGTPDTPGKTTLVIELKALEGTLPDIQAIEANLKFGYQSGLAPTALSTKQGIYVKSSSAVVRGGITIPQK